jgi:hypothetical protein
MALGTNLVFECLTVEVEKCYITKGGCYLFWTLKTASLVILRIRRQLMTLPVKVRDCIKNELIPILNIHLHIHTT